MRACLQGSARIATRIWVLGVALAVLPAVGQAADRLSLCGRVAASATELYFVVAKGIDARIVRSDENETVIESASGSVLWIFLAKPVPAVLCRSGEPAHVESVCDGPDGICVPLIRNLTDDPRARP